MGRRDAISGAAAGRPTETDSIHGAVVRAAERHGIATPMNRALHQLISLAQQRAA